jgi:hypothetical protein
MKRIWCRFGWHSWIEVDREFLRNEECDVDSLAGKKLCLRQTFNIVLQCQYCPEEMKTLVTRTISAGGYDINRDNR